MLPMDDTGFIQRLYSFGLFPSEFKAKITVKETQREKAEHFLDNIIEPSLSIGDYEPFQMLLSIMNQSGYSSVVELAKQLAREINCKFCLAISI